MRKLMLHFSGQEILIKTLQHLDLSLEPILSNSTTVPRIIPHLTAHFCLDLAVIVQK